MPATHPALPEGEDTVVRARQLPLDRRQVPFLLSDSAFHRSSLWGNMSGNTSNDPFAAYQEAAKVMSAKSGSASRTVSGDNLVITGSRRAATVKIEPSALVQTKKSRGGGMATRSSQQPAEVAHSAGSLAKALSNLNLQSSPVSQEELDELKRQVSEEKAQRVAREMEIRDLKDKLKDVDRTAEISSADALSIGKKNQKLEKAIETLRLEMVMAINGARVTARWELMREWLQKKNNQCDLAKALEQYKTVALEEAKNKGAPVPTFEDEPAVLPISGMDIDLRPGGHFHETCSLIHPLEPPGSKVSCLAKCLHPASARRPLLQIHQMYPLRRSPWSTRAPLVYLRDHWLISNKVLGDLVYVRRGTRVLRGPGIASRCNFEGLRRRPCEAVDIGCLFAFEAQLLFEKLQVIRRRAHPPSSSRS
ncbi:hypothetical protein HID58_048135 [Brassica napus]|uniref:RAB6-interacting golgin n=1 Tax=Brassica napus TaxID=3708 RepID=A0ABQ8B255_BRANA|nr:hypothetical protein HID58_048135 [Brassica napus]